MVALKSSLTRPKKRMRVSCAHCSPTWLNRVIESSKLATSSEVSEDGTMNSLARPYQQV
jgi:hypothetical protein